VKWYRLAAEQGYASPQYDLGQMYRKGKGVPQDYAETVRLYRLAAKQGYDYAQTNLGVRYSKGQGVIQDYAIAHMWYNIGAANGHELGGTNRDNLAKKMTQADISNAQAMARECMSSNYKNCGY
jgi:TPR repeat protein